MISHMGTARLTTTPYFPHDHPCFEISYIHKGNGYMRTPDESIRFSQGTIIIVPPKITHTLISDSGHVATSMLIESELFNGIKSTACIVDNSDREAETLIKLMSIRNSTQSKYTEHLGKAFELLILELINKIDLIQQDHSKAIENIIDGIKNNFSDPEFKTKTLLTSSTYAEDYIRSIFKEQTGMTPNQMLIETRLNNAKNLILNSKFSIPVATISLESGFDDFAYFSKAFKKRFGMSPSEYKEKHGKS